MEPDPVMETTIRQSCLFIPFIQHQTKSTPLLPCSGIYNFIYLK